MRKALAALVLAALAQTASANGRDPYVASIRWQRGAEQNIAVGATFGLVLSKDGGATWQWMCEKAIGYGGEYDPDYEYMASGAIFATTFDGLKVMRDGCTFAATPPGMTFVSRIEQDKDGGFFYAASDDFDAKIYKSTNDGVSFTSTTPPGAAGKDWFHSIETAPSDAQRVYVAGYRLELRCTQNSGNPGTICTMNDECTNGGTCEPQKLDLLWKSTNGGTTFTAMNTTGISPQSPNTKIEVAGISHTNPDHVYLKAELEPGPQPNTYVDSIYRSTNAGTSWTKILQRPSRYGLAFLVRQDGTCVAGTRESGAWKSTTCDSDASFTPLANAPRIGCLFENSAGEVWACTQNSVAQAFPTADGFGIMKSTDLVTWTGVFKFEELQAPVSCPVGTVQNDQCVERYMDQSSAWCCLVPQLGLTSTVVDCSGSRACYALVDGPIDAPSMKPPEKGCCETGTSGGPAMLLSGLVAGSLLRRRRKRAA